MNSSNKQIYRVADVEVDTWRGCLKRNGQESYLREQSLQVFLYLVENRVRPVTKEELIENVWQGMAVTDDALVQCIVEIRKALGDDSRHPHFIKTVPKVGYRFIGPVEEPRLAQVTTIKREEVTAVQVEYEEDTETRRRGDTGTRRHGDAETGGRGDGGRDTGTRGHGDAETRRRGDTETRRHGDAGTRGRGDKETRRRGDAETRRHGDTATETLFPRVSVSPRHRVGLLPRVSVSPRHRVVFALALVLVTAAGLSLYFRQRLLNSRRQLSELTLPHVPGKKRVAVMYFENRSGSNELAWLREGLADMLITDLSQSKKLTILSRGQLHLLLERIGHERTHAIRLDEALDIARRSQAEAIVLGSFSQLGENIRIDMQLYEARGGQLMAAEHLVVDKPGQIFIQMDLATLKLTDHLGATIADRDKTRGLVEVMTDSLEAYRYYSLAVEKAQALHNKDAIALLERATALDPQFAMAYARIGYAYAVTWGFPDKGKPFLEKAFQLSGRLTEKDKLHIGAWYAIANLDYAGAINSLQEIIAQYPLEIEAYWRLARLLRGEGQVEDALEVIKRAMVINAEEKELYNELGGIYQELSRHDEAIAMYQRYVELAPEEPNTHDSLGLGYQWAGRYADAIEEYERALALNPDFGVAVIHLGNTYFQQGRYRDAVTQYKRYIKVAASDAERGRGYGCIAHVYWKRRELVEAERAAKKATSYDTSASIIVALERGSLATAEKLKEQFFKLNIPGRGTRGPQRQPAYLRGYIDLKSGRATEAVENLKEALRHRPLIWSFDSLEDCLANGYLELGQLDEAIAEYERILRLNPNYPLAHYHLGQAYERKGQRDQARAAYERFLQIWKDADADIPEVLAAKRQLNGL